MTRNRAAPTLPMPQLALKTNKLARSAAPTTRNERCFRRVNRLCPTQLHRRLAKSQPTQPNQPLVAPRRRSAWNTQLAQPPAQPTYYQPVGAPPQAPMQPQRSGWLWFTRTLAALSVFVIVLGMLALAVGVIGYFWIASQLPPAEELRSRSFQFATTQILDREGNLLWEIIDPTGGRRTNVELEQISPYLIQATVATEDRFFYSNVGVDPIAVVRAIYYNVTEGEIVSGASTITQQLARNVLLTPEERTEQSFSRKIKEAVLAVEINRRTPKSKSWKFTSTRFITAIWPTASKRRRKPTSANRPKT